MGIIKTVRYSTMEDTFLRISDLKVRIRRRRGKGGMPLLLINGMGACLEGWQPVTERLPGRDIIAIDHPGTGLSSPPNHVLTMTQLADFYAEALDTLEVPRADLLSHSFGGTVAQQMAHDYPDRVNSLILAGTTPGTGGFSPDPLTLMFSANPWRYQIPVVREMSAPIIYRGRVGRHPDLFRTELSGWIMHRASLLGIGAQIGAFMGWSSLPWLATIDIPTLVLSGGDDPMVPVANAKLIAAVIPDAELHVFDTAGHLFLFDEPDKVMPVICRFLDDLPSQKAA